MNDSVYLQAVGSIPRSNYAEFNALGNSLAMANVQAAPVLQSLSSKFSGPANELLTLGASSSAVTKENAATQTLQVSATADAPTVPKAAVTTINPRRKPKGFTPG